MMRFNDNKWDAICILGCMTLVVAGSIAAAWLSEKSVEVDFDSCNGPPKRKLNGPNM